MPQYNYETGQMEETEEERKARESAAKTAGETPVAKKEVTTYEDGSQTHVTTQEVSNPAQGITARPTVFDNLGNAIAAMPENFAQPQAQPAQQPVVNPQTVAAARAMAPQVTAQPQAQPQAQQPQFDRNAYNASIAQQESGNRVDIGYHDKTKSSAFGSFGITAPAYADARRRDPSLPADISQATPAQQTQAQNIITDNNARFLQGKGVEVTPGVLSAAHFVGANGLHKFLTQQDEQGRPYISPQAQTANGGYDKARAIIEGRLNGQVAPASGATQQPQVQAQPATSISPYSLATNNTGMGISAPGIAAGQPMTQPTVNYQNLFQENQNNVNGLTQLIDSADTPEYLKRRAVDTRYELVNAAYNEEKARARIPTMTQPEIARAMTSTPKDQEGSYLKMLLLGFISPQLAGAEAIKLGLGPTKWETATITDENGKDIAVEVQRRADGKLLKGNIAGTDTSLTAEQLGQASEGILGKGVHVTKVETRINPQTNEVVSVQTLSDGKQKFLLGGKKYAGDKEALVPEAQHTKQEDTRVNAGYSNLAKLTATPTQQQKFEQLRLAGVSSKRIEQELGLPVGSLEGKTPTSQGAPANQAQAGTAAGYVPPKTAAAATNPMDRPSQQPGEFDKDYKTRLSAWENKTKLQQKDAEEFVKKATDVRSTLGKFKEGIDVINSGVHNLGPNFSLSGAGPLPRVQQFFGEQFGTNGADNTKLLRSLITRGGLEGIKNYMGPAISNFDVETWMKNNPITESSSPQAINAWLTKTHNAMLDAAEMQRKNAIDQGMLAPSFTLGNKIGAPTATSDVRSRADSIIGR